MAGLPGLGAGLLICGLGFGAGLLMPGLGGLGIGINLTISFSVNPLR